jgi:hypothetical protein
MNRFIPFVCLFVFFSCGKSKEKQPTEKKNNDSTTVQNNPSGDKSYLKKRPEEFKEFFMLNSITPFTGRIATKKDVSKKDAVFNMESKGDKSHKALNIRLPFFAFLMPKNNKPTTFVAIMQAEVLKGDTILGYKEASGAFGICSPRELEYFESQKNAVYSAPQ